MLNLLNSRLSVQDLRAIAAQGLQQPIMPPLDSPAWRAKASIPALLQVFAPVLAAAKAEAHEPQPELTDDLYADFMRTGNRLRFEARYFERRRRFCRAALALLLGAGDAGEMTRSFLDKLTSLADEESWALPAHTASATGKDPMLIDLFSSETANTMAETLNIFGAIIPAALKQRILARLRTQIFENYARDPSRFVWTTITNNWNAVCFQGVVGAALGVETDPDIIASLLAAAAQGLPHFLSGFGIDGGTSEGPGYWGYGFGWFAVLNEQLEAATRGALSLFHDDPHIDQIALFGLRMTLSNHRFVNFADGSSTGRLNPRLLGYLGERLDSDVLRQAGQAGYRDMVSGSVDYTAERADLFYFARLIRDWPDEIEDVEFPHVDDFYFRDLDVVVAHRRDLAGRLWEFAAKGGHNLEAHNHNDCGGYLLNVDGAPFVFEIGAPEYDRWFFSPKRYENLAARSLGHSVPIVNGVEQAEGRQYAAVVVRRELGDKQVELDVDLSACYPAEARIASLNRSIRFGENGVFCVRDDYQLTGGAEAVESAIITSGQAARDGSDAIISVDAVQLRVIPSSGSVIGEIQEHGYSDHSGRPQTIRRLVLEPSKRSPAGSIGYALRFD